MALGAWALASPVGASPDEDHHLVSIWCAAGGFPGLCESTGNDQTRLVSPALIESACFAHNPEVSAVCQDDNGVFTSSELVVSGRGNFAGGYPGGFFSVMRVFATADVQSAVVTMRLFNAAVFCSLLAGLTLLSRRSISQVILASAAITVVPLGLFLIPSINPSSWAISAVFAGFFGAYEMFHLSGARRYVLGAIAVLGIMIAATARYDALIYTITAVAVAIFLSIRLRLNKRVVFVSLAALSALFIMFLSLGGFSLVSALVNSAGMGGHAEVSPLTVFLNNITTLPELFAGFSGEMGLGWLDTAMPFSTWFIATCLLWGVLFSRLGYLTARALVATGGVALALVAIPLIVLQVSNATVGQNVQSRYIFPLLLLLVFTILTESHRPALPFASSQKLLIVAGLTLSQFLAIFFNMRRYISVAPSQVTANLNVAAADGWWWNAGPSPMTVLFASLVGFSLFLWLTFVALSRAQRPTHTPELVA
ncbi:MAG: DUF2142 domain-containing protein [Microbacteriaceae bacterium]